MIEPRTWLRTLIDRCQVADCTSATTPLAKILFDVASHIDSACDGLIPTPEQVVARAVLIRTVNHLACHRNEADEQEMARACTHLATGADLRADTRLVLGHCSASISDMRVRRVLEMIRDRCSDRHFTIHIAAADKHVRVAVRTLAAILTRETGSHFSEHVRTERLRRAKTLLESTALSVKEIAHSIGFANESQFVRDFHRHIGITPGEHRRLARA